MRSGETVFNCLEAHGRMGVQENVGMVSSCARYFICHAEIHWMKQVQAERMLEETNAYVNHLVEEHQIMLKAYERAEEVLNAANAQAEATISEANANAEEIRLNALDYTKQMVDNLEDIVSNALALTREHSQGVITGLSASLNVLKENQDALAAQLNEPSPSTIPPVYSLSDNDEDFGEYEDEEEYYEDEEEYEEEYEDEDEFIDEDDEFDYDDID